MKAYELYKSIGAEKDAQNTLEAMMGKRNFWYTGLFLLTFYLLWTVETIKTKTLGRSLKLPIIACIIGCIIYLINIQTSIAYLTIISIASFIFIYKKASSMEDVEMYYGKRERWDGRRKKISNKNKKLKHSSPITHHSSPFLKWAGGKYRIVDDIKKFLPKGNRLVEPFVGSGAVFLNTDYDAYLLADINEESYA
jgi:cbb3-type cytochrome oxidase subunit 3